MADVARRRLRAFAPGRAHVCAEPADRHGQPQPLQRLAKQFATHMRQGTVRCLQRIVARAYRSRPACGGPPAGRRTRTAGRHYHSHMRVCAWWMSAYRRRRLVSARALSGARQDLPRVGASVSSGMERPEQKAYTRSIPTWPGASSACTSRASAPSTQAPRLPNLSLLPP